MSGNPVRIGDGYATVTGYKLPSPLALGREGGSEVKPQVRIPVCLRSSGQEGWLDGTLKNGSLGSPRIDACVPTINPNGQLLRKEKDGASPADCLTPGF